MSTLDQLHIEHDREFRSRMRRCRRLKKEAIAMTDITMCTNTTCPMAAQCYRTTAAPNPYRQSTSRFTYTTDGIGHACDFFYPNEHSTNRENQSCPDPSIAKNV